MARGRRCTGASLLLAGVASISATCCWRAAFVASPGAAAGASSVALRGVRLVPEVAAVDAAVLQRSSGVAVGLAAAAAAGAALFARMTSHGVASSPPARACNTILPLTPSTVDEDVPAVVMNTAGGRRKRLGVGGRVCMLTGKKKHKGIVRTFSEKANKRYWRPNVMWKKFWWAREKKFVRLFVSAAGIKKVDFLGLEQVCKMAGLDLYAWCLPHWMPGSRQPLALKIGYTPESRRDKMFWPDYNKKLNQGAPLSEVCSEPIRPPGKPAPWEPLRRKGPGTPPKFEVKRLVVPKMVNA